MKDLQFNDKVYCPALSTKPFLVYKKKDINGVFIKYRGKEYWFTVNGLPDISMRLTDFNFKNIPSLFLATEENRIKLSELYDMDFLDDFNIPVYAINVARNGFAGSATNDWIFWSQEGYYDWHSPGDKESPTVDDFLWFDIKVSPHTEVLKALISSGKLNHGPHYTIICIGYHSLTQWSNTHVSSVV